MTDQTRSRTLGFIRGDRLVRDLVDGRYEAVATAHEVQAAINYAQQAARHSHSNPCRSACGIRAVSSPNRPFNRWVCESAGSAQKQHAEAE